MKKLCRVYSIIITCSIMVLFTEVSIADDVIIPSKMSKEEIAGKIFERQTMVKTERDGGSTTLDVLTNQSSDKKLETGMFKAGPGRFEITDGYGVDEFMYFLEGSVKLTSKDGSSQTINAGESVVIQKEWSGIWETEGYTKIYVIYSSDTTTE
ncbi:MAG: DUF861 domain-containing protein [Emcibacteraceae bacterium]|nr:DUF861 domain-containing protein [Emcibacteraceae bacterium]